jgi:phage-related protein
VGIAPLAQYIKPDIIEQMKELEFLGDSLKALSEFPKDARQSAGYQLRLVQEGKAPEDFKPMPRIGKGVNEIRIWGEAGTYRVFYVARLEGRIFVLHAFQKKTRETLDRDIEIAKKRLSLVMRG